MNTLAIATTMNLKNDTSRPTIHPYNHETWYDVEFFLGKSHRPKNLVKKAAHDCSDGVCRIRPTKTTGGQGAVPLPDTSVEYTVYGAAWCRFCRKAKMLLDEEKLPFSYYDCDVYQGPQNVKEKLQGLKEHALPATHNTIPIVYHKDEFVGGFSDLVAVLQKEGKASEETLKALDEKSSQSTVEYNKAGHEVTASLDASQWDTTPEYLLAKDDNASLSVKLEISNEGAPVTLYLVAEPPNDEKVVESRKDFLASVKGKEGKKALFRPDGSLFQDGQKLDGVAVKNDFAVRAVLSVTDGNKEEKSVPFADRHLLAVFPAQGESNVTSHMDLTFQKGTKVYVLYFTTEPAVH